MTTPHRDLTQDQMEAFEVYRSGRTAVLRHVPCGHRTPLGPVSLDQLLGVAMDHAGQCPVPGEGGTPR